MQNIIILNPASDLELFLVEEYITNKSPKRFWICQLIFSSSINNIHEPNTILTAICYPNSQPKTVHFTRIFKFVLYKKGIFYFKNI